MESLAVRQQCHLLYHLYKVLLNRSPQFTPCLTK